MEYSDLSHKLTKDISKNDKKNNGIYFTPPETIKHNLDLIHKYIGANSKTFNVLEPSCGSCEYITALNNKFTNINITGIEFNKTIYKSIKSLSKDNINIKNEDFITYNDTTKYDLVIGNPPYFVMKKKDVAKDYYDYFDGRPNIFILFLIKCLKSMLKDDGLLSFVLPKNFLNCIYYDKTRKFINDNYKIKTIIECNEDYIETKQNTIIIIIKNKKSDNTKFVLNRHNFTIFGTKPTIIKLKELYNNSNNLYDLGFNVVVGNVVWNQCKTILTNDKKKTRLIYSSDIADNKLSMKTYQNKDKKNYIEKEGIKEPLLVINRGYGVGNYKFEYCLVNGDFEYLVENHLICIKYTKSITKDKLIELYTKVIKSLENEKIKTFIELYFGNNSINTTELNYIIPIYDM